MMVQITSLCVAAVLAVNGVMIVAEPPSGSPQIVPLGRVQEALDGFVTAKRGEIGFYQHVIELRQLSREVGRDALMQQVAYFLGYSERAQPALFRDVRRVVLNQDEASDVGHRIALSKFLYTPDERVRPVVRSFVLQATSTHSSDDPSAPLNRVLRTLISNRKSDPDWELVHLYYALAPETAVDQLFRSTREGEVRPSETESRQMLWALHVIADTNWKLEHRFDEPQDIRSALTELDRLSRSEKWYVRMYVAEMLRRHETYREKPLLERLRADPNEHVAKRVDLPYYQGMPPEEFEAWKKDIPLMPDRPR